MQGKISLAGEVESSKNTQREALHIGENKGTNAEESSYKRSWCHVGNMMEHTANRQCAGAEQLPAAPETCEGKQCPRIFTGTRPQFIELC
jgi:hypothetical protein